MGRNRGVSGLFGGSRALDDAEAAVKRLFMPSDWLVAAFFFATMALGAGILLANVSAAFSEEVPVHGGVHVEGVVGSPRFINPILAISETDNDLSMLVFGGLMKSGADGALTPYLAEHYEISPDGLTYTFTLKENAVFHDGSPITAEDVVFTVTAAKNPEIKSPRRANWEGVEVVAEDERTVSFILREPYGLFLENTTLGILPKHLWEGVRPEEFPFSDLNANPVGSGMYRVASVKKNASGIPSEYRLVAAGTVDERPYIHTFTFRFYPNHEALAAALASGDIDAAHSLTPAGIAKNVSLEEAVFARVFGVFFNQNQQEIFADEIVRRALDLVLDKDAIVDTVISGYGTALSGPLPPKTVERATGAVDDLEDRRVRAVRLLEEDGWERGDDGVYEKTVKKETKRLAFTLATGNAAELKAAAEVVAGMWREFGAEVTLQFFEESDLNIEVIRPRKYDALLFGLVVGRELDLFAFWHSSQRNDPGLNIALYANIEADQYLEAARNAVEPDERRRQAESAAGEIAGETAAVFLYAPHFTYVHEPELRGIELGTVSVPKDRFAGIENWYVNTENVWPIFTR